MGAEGAMGDFGAHPNLGASKCAVRDFLFGHPYLAMKKKGLY
jgi:hypothetical protein